MIEDIEKIIKIFEKAKISKLDLELENMKIKLEKNENEAIIINSADVATQVVSNQEPVKETKNTGKAVTSPVVGTFYLQKAPDNPPLIEVGQKVKKGDVLCIIEAMKVMNEIVCPCSGVITDILVNNEDIVEYGQELIMIGEAND